VPTRVHPARVVRSAVRPWRRDRISKTGATLEEKKWFTISVLVAAHTRQRDFFRAAILQSTPVGDAGRSIATGVVASATADAQGADQRLIPSLATAIIPTLNGAFELKANIT
jgi:hypothetical protein